MDDFCVYTSHIYYALVLHCKYSGNTNAVFTHLITHLQYSKYIPKRVEIGPSGRGGTLIQNITMLHNITCVTFFRVITFRRDNRSDPAKAKL